MMIDCQNKSRDVENLKTASIRLFGLYRDVINQKSDSEVFNVYDAVSSGEGEDASEIGENDAFAIRKARPGRRNRHGMETSAIRKTQSQTNMENGVTLASKANPGSTAKLVCYRCGKAGHTLKQCPLPFQPKLAFAPVRPAPKRNFVSTNDNDDHVGEIDPEMYIRIHHTKWKVGITLYLNKSTLIQKRKKRNGLHLG